MTSGTGGSAGSFSAGAPIAGAEGWLLSISGDLGVSGPPGPRLRHCTRLALVLLAAWLLAPQLFLVDPQMPGDGHAQQSLDIAFTHAACGTGYSIDRSFSLAQFLVAHPERRHAPMRDVAAAGTGSLGRYCASARPAEVNSENSLALVEWAAMILRPGISLAGLAELLHLLRVSALAFAAFGLLSAGMNLVVVSSVLLGGCWMLKVLEGAALSGYPFLFVLIAVVVGTYSWAFTLASMSRMRTRVWLALAVGMLCAFGANMRTSHVPVYAALLAAGSLMGEWLGRRDAADRALRGTAAVLLAGAAGVAVFQFGVMGVLLRGASPTGSAAHSVAHPLVLSLALPPSALSDREGIRWEDRAGLEIARRSNPQVPYLGDEYERTLFGYYRGLWQRYPREMLAIYAAKLRVTGRDVLAALTYGSLGFGAPAAWLFWTSRLMRNGVVVFFAEVSLCLAALWTVRAGRWTAAVPVALFSGAAALLQLEAAVIVPYFFLPYHNFTAFYSLFTSALGYQVLVMALVLVARRTGAAGLMSEWTPHARRWAALLAEKAMVSRGPRALAQSAGLLALLVAAIAVARPSFFIVDRPSASDGHALQSLDLAIGRAWCGAPYGSSQQFKIPSNVRDRPSLGIMPIRSVIDTEAGSLAAYCGSLVQASANHGNALALAESWILRARPQLSVAGLGRALHAARVCGVLLFGLLLLNLGRSPATTLAIVVASLLLLGDMQAQVHAVYPFLFVLVLVAVSLYALALRYRWTRTTSRSIGGAVLAGAGSAFGAAMWASYLPLFGALFALFLWADSMAGRKSGMDRRWRLVHAAVMLGGFVAGYAAFEFGVIARGLPPAAGAGDAARPVVLAGAHLITTLTSGAHARLTKIVLAPILWLPDGLAMLGLWVLVAVVSAARHVRGGSVFAFTLALLASAAALVQIDAGVAAPSYVENYHNYLAFFAVFFCVFVWQCTIDVAWTLGGGRGR